MSKLANNEGDEKGKNEGRTTGGEKRRGPAAPGSTPPNGGTVPRPRTPFLATVCRDCEITQETLTAKQVRALKVTDVDCHIDEVFGPISIGTKSGKRLEYVGEIRGVGEETGRPFLNALMRRPGELLSAHYLYNIPGLDFFLRPDVRAANLQRLRKGFGETGKAPWFFRLVGHPWRVGWRAERSWRVISRLAPPTAT